MSLFIIDIGDVLYRVIKATKLEDYTLAAILKRIEVSRKSKSVSSEIAVA